METVLYVDDDLINLKVMELNLQCDFEMLTAASGANGLTLLKDNPNIEFVLSDFMMPKMNGFEFIQKVKAIRPDLKCYIITGYPMDDALKAAVLTKLIDGYIKKPFDCGEIKKIIHEKTWDTYR